MNSINKVGQKGYGNTMEEKRFDNDFEYSAEENRTEVNFTIPNVESNPYYKKTYNNQENAENSFEPEAPIPPFTEKVKKERKKISTNKKIVLSSIFGGIGGCIVSMILIIALLNSGIIGSFSASHRNNLNVHVSDAPIAGIVATGDEASLADIIDAVGPAVVGINSRMETTDWFWGTSVSDSSGSGVIINEEGYIVTNNHVIENASGVTVTLISGETYEAKLIGTDSRTDLAVIKIEADTPLTYAVIGDSSQLRVGDSVVAIGNPLGDEFAGSATKGIISATNRTVHISDKTLTVLQTDAAINPGNSGGALVNMNGEVIGINTAKIADSTIEGLGFSIPSNEFLPVINDLMETGHVTGRPLIGITGRSITKELSEQYGFPIGVYVVEVAPFSGAEDAGIRNKDVITEVNGEKVESVEDINKIRDNFKAGDSIKMKIYRKANDKTLEVDVVLGEDTGDMQ